jgi:hypothetical protein
MACTFLWDGEAILEKCDRTGIQVISFEHLYVKGFSETGQRDLLLTGFVAIKNDCF